MRLDLNNDATTDIEPDVVMPPSTVKRVSSMEGCFRCGLSAQETDPG